MAQTPGRGEIFLDHVGWYVPDMDAAAAAFTRLGFELTPFVAHTNADPAGGPPVPSGTGNCCAMLSRGYIEILAAMPGAETKLAAQLRAGLGRYTGLHLIAFTVADAEAGRERLHKAGFAPEPIVHLRRPIETEGGAAGEVGFTVVRLPPAAMAEGRIQMLTQETPELAWQDRFIARRNGIVELSGVLVCSADPAEAASRFARFTGRAAAGGGDRWSIALDRGGLEFAAPGPCGGIVPGIDIPATPFIAALALASGDMAATAQYFDANGISYGRIGDTLHVAAADALGATLIVHPVGDAWLAR
jgi:catechol 2,3-dioxygenase-like lactoylglutathione lyase family enzyme